MALPARYEIVEDSPTRLVLRDLGPWETFLTITNDVERVVRQVAPRLGSRWLYYYDSEGGLSEIEHSNGQFRRFL